MNNVDGKIIRQYHDCNNIKVTLEIPLPDKSRDKDGIEDIKRIMNNELLLQINK